MDAMRDEGPEQQREVGMSTSRSASRWQAE